MPGRRLFTAELADRLPELVHSAAGQRDRPPDVTGQAGGREVGLAGGHQALVSCYRDVIAGGRPIAVEDRRSAA